MIFKSLKEFSLLQQILGNVNQKSKKDIDAILDDPVALASIFTLASYLKLELPYYDLKRLSLSKTEEREFIRHYLIGVSIVILELKTHNCCGIQRKFMKLYKQTLIDSAVKKNYNFLDSVIND